MASWNGYNAAGPRNLYIVSGDTTDWAYGQRGIFAFTFELDPGSDYGYSGFYPGASVIQEVVDKNYAPVLYMIDVADNPYRVAIIIFDVYSKCSDRSADHATIESHRSDRLPN